MSESDDDLTESLIRVVCAAIRHKETGLVIAGVRHLDGRMHDVIRAMKTLAKGTSAQSTVESIAHGEQGFLTNTGEFLTREQAWRVAEAANQIRKRHGQIPGTLHSEDCW